MFKLSLKDDERHRQGAIDLFAGAASCQGCRWRGNLSASPIQDARAGYLCGRFLDGVTGVAVTCGRARVSPDLCGIEAAGFESAPTLDEFLRGKRAAFIVRS